MSREPKETTSARFAIPTCHYVAVMPFVFLGLSLLLINCGGDGGNEGSSNIAYPPAIEEIAGTYSLKANLTDATGICDSIPSLDNAAIEMTTDGMDVVVHSATPIRGAYNSSDGSYVGSAGVLHIAEGIDGRFSKDGSVITLTGIQRVHLLSCDMLYDVIYTKN